MPVVLLNKREAGRSWVEGAQTYRVCKQAHQAVSVSASELAEIKQRSGRRKGVLVKNKHFPRGVRAFPRVPKRPRDDADSAKKESVRKITKIKEFSAFIDDFMGDVAAQASKTRARDIEDADAIAGKINTIFEKAKAPAEQGEFYFREWVRAVGESRARGDADRIADADERRAVQVVQDMVRRKKEADREGMPFGKTDVQASFIVTRTGPGAAPGVRGLSFE